VLTVSAGLLVTTGKSTVWLKMRAEPVPELYLPSTSRDSVPSRDRRYASVGCSKQYGVTTSHVVTDQCLTNLQLHGDGVAGDAPGVGGGHDLSAALPPDGGLEVGRAVEVGGRLGEERHGHE